MASDAPFVPWVAEEPPPRCEITPAAREDGLYELRGLASEFGPACTAEDVERSPVLAWVSSPGRMAIGVGGYDRLEMPLAIREGDGERIVEVPSRTDDRRCTAIGEAPGQSVPIDRPDQATLVWVGLDAGDGPVRIEQRYTTGGCAFERSGDTTTVEIPDGVERGGDTGYEVSGAVLLVFVQYDEDMGDCVGSDPSHEPDHPGGVKSLPSGSFASRRIVVAAVADTVIVRAQIEEVPPCE